MCQMNYIVRSPSSSSSQREEASRLATQRSRIDSESSINVPTGVRHRHGVGSVRNRQGRVCVKYNEGSIELPKTLQN